MPENKLGKAQLHQHLGHDPGRRLALKGAGLAGLAGAGSIVGGAAPAQETASKPAE
jgi:hypothetical protein